VAADEKAQFFAKMPRNKKIPWSALLRAKEQASTSIKFKYHQN
jgi:hypothetical protein